MNRSPTTAPSAPPSARNPPGYTASRDRRGFTLIELLVVICILSILITLSVVAIGAFLDKSNRQATESLLESLSAAVINDSLEWGDYPPSSLAEIGGTAPNDLKGGVKTLAACLSSRQRGGPIFHNEEAMSNVDNDGVDRNLTGWYWGDHPLFEYHDFFGHVIVYFHARDFEKPRKGITRYRCSPDGAEFGVGPQLHPVLKSFVGTGRFQLRCVGKPGTDDELWPDSRSYGAPSGPATRKERSGTFFRTIDAATMDRSSPRAPSSRARASTGFTVSGIDTVTTRREASAAGSTEATQTCCSTSSAHSPESPAWRASDT